MSAHPLASPSTVAAHRGLNRLLEIASGLQLAPQTERFYFLRHGQTECNARRIFQSYEEPLNATGIAQAEAAGKALAREPIATIVCSDVARTHHTASIVAAHHVLTPNGAQGLRERHFGELIGSSSADLDWDCRPAQGETLDLFVERTRDALEQALLQPGPVLVVAHGGTLYVLAALLSVPVTPTLLGNAHPLRFDRIDTGWQATALAAALQGGPVNLS
ncbi:histidine phosphatase family protein [Verticiella sediminum]|uniref:Histidine phosphatase family protein n=1 Tax=Verticiella sediminum TaxID=1247510 RepID=A0A556AYK1_9BURK|nr:histidine phosphatase family protein [Verticiella sediminum]TSH98002.1 histidine phosphatase family protein [Verticiella sediminum]